EWFDQAPEVGLSLRGQLRQQVHAPLLWQWLVCDFGSRRDRDHFEPERSAILRSAIRMSVAVRQMMANTRMRADGSKLKAARDAKRWSQEDLARAAGYALSSIQKLEQGTYFSLRCLECCAEALKIPVADLIKGASERVVVTSPATHDLR